MENFEYNPLEQQPRQKTPEAPILDEEEIKKDTIVETKQEHLDLARQYDQLSPASQDLYREFTVMLAESKGTEGASVQEALLKLSLKHSLPDDFKQFIRNNFDLPVPAPSGNGGLFRATGLLAEERNNLRLLQLQNEVHGRNRINPPEEEPTLWETVKEFFRRKPKK